MNQEAHIVIRLRESQPKLLSRIVPLEGAVFGLYTAEAIGVIPKNTLVNILTTDASGMAVSSATLPFGKYYLRELKLPDNTIHMSEESYPLTVKGHKSIVPQ